MAQISDDPTLVATVLPDAQIRRAYALALEHAHGWACALDDAGLRPEGMTLREIAAVTAAGGGWGPIAPIPCPQLDESGCVIHRTATGRLSWRVEPDGAVTVALSRPAGAAIEVHVCADGAVYAVPPPGPDTPPGEVPPDEWTGVALWPRHVDALLRAVAAVIRC